MQNINPTNRPATPPPHGQEPKFKDTLKKEELKPQQQLPGKPIGYPTGHPVTIPLPDGGKIILKIGSNPSDGKPYQRIDEYNPDGTIKRISILNPEGIGGSPEPTLNIEEYNKDSKDTQYSPDYFMREYSPSRYKKTANGSVPTNRGIRGGETLYSYPIQQNLRSTAPSLDDIGLPKEVLDKVKQELDKMQNPQPMVPPTPEPADSTQTGPIT